jgi:hypothetical protein
MKSKQMYGLSFTSPFGRGRRAAPGEGLRPHDRPYPLTPTLSQSKSDLSDFDNSKNPTRVNPSWGERGRTAAVATPIIKQNCSEGAFR